ncbi:hypothetical protein [Denitromonas sp.]|uniref:hypothetical protein n=2 Tax=Denitromonas sp. TaxID=2734609 RepID=UPI003A844062
MVYPKATPKNRAKRLMTEAEAKEAELLWGAYEQRQRAVSTLSAFDLSERELENRMRLGARTDVEALKSILLAVANTSVDLHHRKMAHYQLAILEERDGQPYREHLAWAAKYQLLRFEQDGVQKVRILTAGELDSCPSCQSQSGRVLSVGDALCQMPIPCAGCTRTLVGEAPGFCRCMYVADLN